ncbi:hypothetical protein FRACYDRAFT_268871 [Fragilariopsis cylindrus CCMP1102]|uniref:Uncharacterized protein n=1 Tax=Fragilariopsis cylindrus CCMP1102 TaxID=635003 RepID=A0A1E7FJ00_9STRA|nr:hypothetical protein FRACYDRAFT_268871 [Fragilariopsis cylindrus CCMP1102]|eukprot:OEU18151.1 hypothetical protein FRACYDRAFT_268871 [Fragilariopsis cylindrus CCMP1102]
MTTTAPTKDERAMTVVGLLIIFLVPVLLMKMMIDCIKTLITSASTMVMSWYDQFDFYNEIMSESRMIQVSLGTMWNGWMLSFINERTIGIAAFIIIGTMNFLQQRNNHAALSADIRQLSNAIAENNHAALRHREQQHMVVE